MYSVFAPPFSLLFAFGIGTAAIINIYFGSFLWILGPFVFWIVLPLFGALRRKGVMDQSTIRDRIILTGRAVVAPPRIAKISAIVGGALSVIALIIGGAAVIQIDFSADENLDVFIGKKMDKANVQGLAVVFIENGQIAWSKNYGLQTEIP